MLKFLRAKAETCTHALKNTAELDSNMDKKSQALGYFKYI